MSNMSEEFQDDIKEYIRTLPRAAITHSEYDNNGLLRAIDMLIDKKLKGLKFNRTSTGIILKNNGDETYLVSVNNTDTDVLRTDKDGNSVFVSDKGYNYPAIKGMTYDVDDMVYLEVVNNDSNFQYIKCKAPKRIE